MEFTVSAAIDVLRRTPATLDALLRDLPEGFERANEGPDTFSPFDNVGHLIDGEETDWMPRARIILHNKDKRFEPYDRFRHHKRNQGRKLKSLLEDFTQLRAENLALLAAWNLTDEQLAMTGIHPTFGPVTLRQLLAAWVVHDLGHIAQIARVMAKQYTTEVGPWVPFMPVLTDRVKN